MRFVALILASLSVATVRADVSACNPIGFPCFTIDRTSPIAAPLLPPGALLEGPPGPTIVRPPAFFGLVPGNDDLDGVSRLNTGVTGMDTFLILFSVDRRSRGAQPPDPNLAAQGLPFNVRNQSENRQQAADAFAGLNLFTRSGIVPTGPSPSAPSLQGGMLRIGGGNNTLFVNQGDASGIDFAVGPDISPASTQVDPQSNVNGMAGAQEPNDPNAALRLRGDAPSPPPTHVDDNRFAFTVQKDSPSLGGLPGPPSGANVYLAIDPSLPMGGVQVYALATEIGLFNGDDIDGLLVFENGDGVFNQNQDQIIFTLDRGSPTLNLLNAEPGDLFTTTMGGGFAGYAQANTLGLGGVPDPMDPNGIVFDNIDALDFVLCDDRVACLTGAAIGFPCATCPGDVNSDGVVDLNDLAIVLANFGKVGVPPELGDLNGDGAVTLADLADVLANFGNVCS